MHRPYIFIEEFTRTDETGREIRTFVPVFKPDGVASGELRFACFEAWEDKPDTFTQAKDAALFNAIVCMKGFADKL